MKTQIKFEIVKKKLWIFGRQYFFKWIFLTPKDNEDALVKSPS